MFDKFIELFRTGTHTDNAGNTKTWTDAECRQMVADYSKATMRSGHHDKTSYGTLDKVKFENGVVSGLFTNVDKTFASIVKSGEILNRSIGLKNSNGKWGIDHVAFLGKSEPAIAGLAPMFSKADIDAGDCHSYTFSFEVSELDINPWRYQGGMRSAAALFRKIRDFIIDKHDIETADAVLSDWEIQAVNDAEQAIKPKEKEFSTDAGASNTGGTMPNPEKAAEAQFTQADVDAAAKKATIAAEAKFEKAQDAIAAKQAAKQADKDNAAAIKQFVSSGNITPAQAQGMPEFMAQLNAKDKYNFSRGDDDEVATKATAWFADFIASLNSGVKTDNALDIIDAADVEITATQVADFAKKHNMSVLDANDALIKQQGEK